MECAPFGADVSIADRLQPSDLPLEVGYFFPSFKRQHFTAVVISGGIAGIAVIGL